MTVELRPYQCAAIDAIRQEFIAGKKSTLLVLATGLGKTVVFAEILRRTAAKGRRGLVVAHREELLKQANGKLAAIGVNAAIEQAGKRATADAPVVVASVQTLKGKRLQKFAPDAFDLVVIDEAHHATADGYRAVIEHFPSARILGVTATPDRLDGVGLGRVFESCAYKYELHKAIRDGWLAEVRARRIVLKHVDLDGVRTRAGDLETNALAVKMSTPEAIHGVARPMIENIGDRQTIAFAVSVEHAHAIATALNTYREGCARAIDGSASSTEREAAVADFASGKIQILVNCALYTEGFDAPVTSCIAIARPTKSRALYSQMIGRGTRLFPGKTDCMLLDFVGLVGRHRLAGPADVLADVEDPLSEEEREEIERLMAEDCLTIDEAAFRSRERQERLRRKAIVSYTATEIDPFVGAPVTNMLRWSGDAATEKQLEALTRAGIEPPQGLTKGDASSWLQVLADRRERGLCTYKQARCLRKRGVDPINVTFEEASKIISTRRDFGGFE